MSCPEEILMPTEALILQSDAPDRWERAPLLLPAEKERHSGSVRTVQFYRRVCAIREAGEAASPYYWRCCEVGGLQTESLPPLLPPNCDTGRYKADGTTSSPLKTRTGRASAIPRGRNGTTGRSLQNRCGAARAVLGGFDFHALPPLITPTTTACERCSASSGQGRGITYPACNCHHFAPARRCRAGR